MQDSKRRKFKKYFEIVILVIFFIILQIGLQVFPRINLGMFKGVLASFQYGVCLLLLRKNYKINRRLSIFLIIFAFLGVSADVIRGNTSSIPGVFNGLFFVITIILINRYNTEREKDNRTDLITGVYNRKGLYIELENLIDNGKEFEIIYLSIDNFKAINDGYGHAYGDELLRKIIKRIKLRFDKNCLIARVGGAEFVVIVNGAQKYKEMADRLVETISEKSILVVDGNQVDCYVTCYSGVSKYPSDASDYESLIKYADIAMSTAKEEKSKEAYIFNESMLEKMNRQNYVEKQIKDSLTRDNFYLVYQPQYHSDKKALRGFETLLRMKADTGEIINPGEFIPIAEKNDLIFQIDNYVLINAMNEFKDVVIENPELMISINVSAKDFASVWFVDKIKKMLAETHFPAKNLEIEITEYCMVTSMEATVGNINNLRELGVGIALDDFGTGYSSLDYVSRLPIDLLKIDKSLIDEMENNKKRRDFVHAVINMGQLMNCEVISEGVENIEQVKFLNEYGCDFIQGFVWGKPISFADAKKLIKEFADQ